MAVFDVTIDSSLVPASKTDIPILIDLSDMPAGFWSVVTSGGGDIRCYESDGTTELARDVVSCNTGSSVGELWVKVANLSSSADTVIKVEVDGVSSDYAVTDTYGRNAVWSDYEAVWHLNESATGGSGSIVDSTGNGHNGTPSGWGASGQVSAPWGAAGGALEFDGSNDWISVPDDPGLELLVSGGANYAVQYWAYPLSTWSNILLTKYDEWNAQFNNTSAGSGVSPRFNTYGDNNQSALSANHVTVNAWNQYLFWGDPGTNHKTYHNSTLRGTKAITDTSAGTTNVLEIGRESGGPLYGHGRADEIRIATGTRADALDNTDWQTIEYNNIVNIATFYSIAAAGGVTVPIFHKYYSQMRMR